jgi:hypothetical protein
MLRRTRVEEVGVAGSAKGLEECDPVGLAMADEQGEAAEVEMDQWSTDTM